MKGNLFPPVGHTDYIHPELSFSSMARAQGHPGFLAREPMYKWLPNPTVTPACFSSSCCLFSFFLKGKRRQFPGPGCLQLAHSHEQPQNNTRRGLLQEIHLLHSSKRQQKHLANAKPCRSQLLAPLQENTALPARLREGVIELIQRNRTNPTLNSLLPTTFDAGTD